MTPPPLPLRVRDAADYAQQIAFHRCNAIAKAMLTSSCKPIEGVPQKVPYAAPRVSTLGSDLAAKLEIKKKQYVIEEQRSRAPDLHWEEAEKRVVRADNLRYAIYRLDAQLEALPDPSKGTPPGIPGWFVVTVPALHTTGWLEVVTSPVTYELDTRYLSGELRGRIDAWLYGTSDEMPYWHCRSRWRYYARSRVPDDIRALLMTLNGYMEAPEANELLTIQR